MGSWGENQAVKTDLSGGLIMMEAYLLCSCVDRRHILFDVIVVESNANILHNVTCMDHICKGKSYGTRVREC